MASNVACPSSPMIVLTSPPSVIGIAADAADDDVVAGAARLYHAVHGRTRDGVVAADADVGREDLGQDAVGVIGLAVVADHDICARRADDDLVGAGAADDDIVAVARA